MILVTGATGFLGAELVKELLKSGERVRALKRATSAVPALLVSEKTLEWTEADLLDYFALERAFDGVTHVYHCAALLSFAAEDRKKQLRVNKEGTYNIVNLCLQNQVEKLVHVSSVAALGETKDRSPVTEKTQWEFDGTQQGYSISKYESEMEVWRGMAEGLNAVIVNPSIIIGGSAGKKGSGQLFETVRKGLKFYTAGGNGFVDVEDVVQAMILLMRSDVSAERFILNAENLSLKQFFTQVATQFNLSPPHIEVKPWLMEVGWRGAGFLSLLNGRKYALNRDTARNSFKKMSYSSSKFLRLFPDFKFKPIEISIKEVCDALKK